MLRPAIIPFTVAMLFTAACWLAAGPTLGLFLGGIVIVALLVPPLVLAEQRWLDRLIAGGSVVDGIGVVWLVAIFFSPVSFVQWLLLYLLLIAFGFSLFALVILLRRGWVLTSALVVVLGLAWLSWPVWMAPWLEGPRGEAIAAWLVPAHPIFAANAVLREMGIWTQLGIAYRLVNLGQDIPYVLPPGIRWAFLLHVLLGVALTAAAWAMDRREPEPADQPEAARAAPAGPPAE